MVKATQLTSMVLLDSEVSDVMKSQLRIAAAYNNVNPVPSSFAPDQRCAGALLAAAEPTYRGSKYVAIAGIGMLGADDRLVDQAVVAFVDAAEAQNFVDTRVAQWKDCVDKVQKLAPPNASPSYWVARSPVSSYGVHVLLRNQEGAGGFSCSHGLTAAANVVIDVVACGPQADDLNDQVSAIANKIVAKLPA